MSKGSPVLQVRCPQELLDRINADIVRVNGRRKEAPLIISTWLMEAISEKLAKRERSRIRGGSKYNRGKRKLPKREPGT